MFSVRQNLSTRRATPNASNLFAKHLTHLIPRFLKPGIRVIDTKPGSIPRGTAIATFDKYKKYPTDGLGKHAAIYLSHDASGIRVLDQWDKQGEVLERVIHVNKPDVPRVNSAKHYFVIE
jgi:hypothetical protein